MAKKGLAALASKQINSTAQPLNPAPIDAPHEAEAPDTMATKEEAPAVVLSEEKKSGRPKTITEEVAPLTVRLPKTLLHELKLRAVMEHTTQTEIIGTLIKSYLNK